MAPWLKVLTEKLLSPNQDVRARMGPTLAIKYIQARYGFAVASIEELDSYDDLNFHVMIKPERQSGNFHVHELDVKNGYVLKITNSIDSKNQNIIEAQNELLVNLASDCFPCPLPVKQKNGAYYSLECIGDNGNNKLHILRLFHFIPGKTLSHVPVTEALLKNFGLYIAKLDGSLSIFSNHPAFATHRTIWSLAEVPRLRSLLYILSVDEYDHDLINEIITKYEKDLEIKNKVNLTDGLVHGDLNDTNIIVKEDTEEIQAAIDFGEVHKGFYIYELAVALVYILIKTDDLAMCSHVVKGYNEIREVDEVEREVLKLCMCCRLIQSLVLGEHLIKVETESMVECTSETIEFILRDKDMKWYYVKKLWAMDNDEFLETLGLFLPKNTELFN